MRVPSASRIIRGAGQPRLHARLRRGRGRDRANSKRGDQRQKMASLHLFTPKKNMVFEGSAGPKRTIAEGRGRPPQCLIAWRVKEGVENRLNASVTSPRLRGKIGILMMDHVTINRPRLSHRISLPSMHSAVAGKRRRGGGDQQLRQPTPFNNRLYPSLRKGVLAG